MEKIIRTIFWKDDAVVMIDQRALPLEERYVTCTDYREVIAAINDLTIRGAPAIGVAAAMGIALGALRIDADTPDSLPRRLLRRSAGNSRPPGPRPGTSSGRSSG